MHATRKMKALKPAELADLADKCDRHLVTVYRWMRDLEAGRGIRDENKRRLIAATAGTPHALEWADFYPAEGVVA